MKVYCDLTNSSLCPYHPHLKLIDPLTGAAIATGGASLLGSLFNFGSQKSTNKMQERMFNTQMDYVKAAEQRSYDYQDKAWQRETEYNSPAAQRARFEAAGLNPAMMMEGQNAVVGSMGEPSTPSAPSSPTLQAPQLDLTGLGNSINSYYQNAVLQSQMQKTDREGYLLGIEGQYAHQKQQLDLRERLGRINQLAEDSKLSAAQREYYKDQSEQIRQLISFNDATFNARMQQENKKAYVLEQQGQLLGEQITKAQVDNFWNDLEHELQIDISRSTKKRIDSQILVDASTVRMNDANAKKLAAEYSKTILEAAELTPDNPMYKRKKQVLKAQIYNLLKGKINIFGVGADIPQTTSGWVFGDD